MKANIILKRGKEHAILRKHHWIFSGAMYKVDESIENGALTDVYSSDDKFICRGLYHDANIAFRILTFDIDEKIDKSFWINRLQTAFKLRKTLNIPNENTELFRLFHGEGDRIPGLVIDVYSHTAVIQLHYPGLEVFLEYIEAGIRALSLSVDRILIKKTYQEAPKVDIKESPNVISTENGIKFAINPMLGQKTGFFIDQRDNRKLLSDISYDKTVLNLFCYTGAFSMYALKNGAKSVCSIDSSTRAIEQLEVNMALNKFDDDKHTSVIADVMTYINGSDFDYDVIVVDPPAFAKHKSKRHNAIQAYKRLNQAVFTKCKPGAIILTFSCSQVITKDIFRNTMYSAALESKRDIRVLKELNQAPDHPVNIFHPETDYLKGLMIMVM